MTATHIIQMNNVTKQYGAHHAVKQVSLDVQSGEFLSILGPSGCGKTTTLRMIAGFEYPTTGAIYLDGADSSKVPPHLRPVNTVFQNYALFPHLTIFDNIAFGLKRQGLKKEAIQTEVAQMLDMMGLVEQQDKYPNQLSGGQQQRVALARALVNKPKVLLLDEPLGALDLKLRKKMQFELKRLHKQVGITFIFVTHDQEEALVMSDRIVVMNEGQIDQVGTPEEIYQNPATSYVAEFIGDANILQTEKVTRDQIRVFGQNFTVSPQSQNESFVLRPEHIQITAGERTPANENLRHAPATVIGITYAGAKQIIEVNSFDQSIMVHCAPDELDENIRIGGSCTISWHEKDQKIL